MSNDIKENIFSGRAWLRILLMLVYTVFAWVVGFVIIFLIIVQAICNLLFGENNQQVKDVSSAAVDYFYEILTFMTYCSDKKPAPFSSFNDGAEDEVENTASDDVQAEVKTSVNTEEATDSASEANANSTDSDFEDDVFADISFTAQESNEQALEESEEGSEEESDDDNKPQGSV